MDNLRCNRLTCRRALTEKAVVVRVLYIHLRPKLMYMYMSRPRVGLTVVFQRFPLICRPLGSHIFCGTLSKRLLPWLSLTAYSWVRKRTLQRNEVVSRWVSGLTWIAEKRWVSVRFSLRYIFDRTVSVHLIVHSLLSASYGSQGMMWWYVAIRY